MKRLTLLMAAALAFASTAFAQDDDSNFFNHLSVAPSIGTDGFGFDVAAPIGHYVQMRAGMSFLPSVNINVDNIEYTYKGKDREVDGKISIKKSDFKLLFDLYPSKTGSFHFTVGAFIGGGNFVEAKDRGEGLDLSEGTPGSPGYVPSSANWGTAKVQIDNNPDHMFGTDPNGHIKARLRVASFKPYLGIGFGRVVNPKKFVSVNFDMGVQFWGTPKLEFYNYQKMYMPGEEKWVRVKKSDFDSYKDTSNPSNNKDRKKDAYDALDILDKVTVYPVLSLRIGFRAF